jgi:ankyrin repeat protein
MIHHNCTKITIGFKLGKVVTFRWNDSSLVMTDSTLTPFYLFVCIIISLGFACLEVAWLTKTFQLSAQWATIAIIGASNFLMLLLGYFVISSYLVFFFFPIPVVPALLIGIKVLMYVIVKRTIGPDLHGLWLVSSVTVLTATIIGSMILGATEKINPTYQNLYVAIEKGERTKLEVMLWISVNDKKMMNDLVVSALSYNNSDALTSLFRHGADPKLAYPYQHGSLETSWQLLKWQLDNVTPIDSIPSLGESLSYYSVKQLAYAISKGLDVRKYPNLLHDVMRNHTQRGTMTDVIDADEDMTRKITLLFEHGASTDDRDRYDYKPISALFGSRCHAKNSVLKTLLDKGANANEQTSQAIYINDYHFMPAGFSPLMSAVLLDDEASVKLLLEKGADKSLLNSEGKSALDYVQYSTAAGKRIRLLF